VVAVIEMLIGVAVLGVILLGVTTLMLHRAERSAMRDPDEVTLYDQDAEPTIERLDHLIEEVRRD
jgi:Tfp pilus assembly protein PilV